MAGLVFGEAGLGGLERYVRSVGVGAGAFSRKRSSRVRGRLAGFPITVSGRLSMVDAHACFGFSKFFDLFFFFPLTQSHSYLHVEIGLKLTGFRLFFFQLTLQFSTLRMAVHLRENRKFLEVPWKKP